MNRSELVDRLAARCGITKQRARRIVAALFGARTGIIASALRAGDTVTMAGFGTLRPNPVPGPREESIIFRASFAATRRARAQPAADEPLLLGGEAPTDVHFTAYHPKEIPVTSWSSVLVYAHVPSAAEAVERDRNLRFGADTALHAPAHAKATSVIRRGAAIAVVPELTGCRFNPPRATFLWLKDWHRVEFDVQADPELPRKNGAVNGRVAFYVGPVLVGEMEIQAHLVPVSGDAATAAATSVTATPYRKIFVSYSHDDAQIVEALEAAAEALGDVYLRDVRTLRAGEPWGPALLELIERADVFQLCWSHAAKRSRYVRHELTHALAQRRPKPFIRPTYWERPMPAPPRSLKGIQFSYLAITHAGRHAADLSASRPGYPPAAESRLGGPAAAGRSRTSGDAG
ncbi:Bacterial DNA-binding protein [Luteitalea pratensis]|uniref:Bacterial DNA-binding protein n=1 Tax=Luteitalea pratensis TaxID=1855912 RepID=A0A143PN08_LUTPR|nr:TIR domain-containing protein [Luteitalea pratensis]AMY09468.1 Bacterial DNA-binding protein [Luteitalea pratensis]